MEEFIPFAAKVFVSLCVVFVMLACFALCIAVFVYTASWIFAEIDRKITDRAIRNKKR